jgi:hypothetical protein
VRSALSKGMFQVGIEVSCCPVSAIPVHGVSADLVNESADLTNTGTAS